jgi:hypothetical protein
MEGFLMGCAREGVARALALTDKQTAAVHYKRVAEILRSDLASIELG